MIKRGYGGGCYLRGLPLIGMVLLVLLGASTGADGQEIRVKFLDGRTGHPVTYEAAQMWVENVRGVLLAPANNPDGTAKFFYTGQSIRGIWPHNTKLRYSWQGELTVPPGLERIAVGQTVEAGICWDPGPSRMGPWYRISDILQHGAVSENHCGNATAKPQPGELILFIKPVSAWRRILDGFRS